MKENMVIMRRTILIDLVFNGLNQLNGFKVEGPDKDYYVDGLYRFLHNSNGTVPSYIKCTDKSDIWYIFRYYRNNHIHNRRFPKCNESFQLTLQEANMFPYLEVPDYCFRNTSRLGFIQVLLSVIPYREACI